MSSNQRWRGSTTLSIYGRQTLLDALAAHANRSITVHDIRLAKAAPADYTTALRASVDALHRAGINPPQLDITTPKRVNELSRDPRHDQGVAARVTLDNVITAEQFTDTLKGKRAARPARLIALDGLTNPQNIGMIIRAATAANFDAVLWPKQGSPWINGLLIKASAATVFHTTIALCDTLDDGIDTLKQRGFTIAALHADAEPDTGHTTTAPLFHHNPPHNACYIVGAEAEGVSQAALQAADTLIEIPTNPLVESLNAATAAAVLCFHVAREDHAAAPKR